VSNLGPQTLQTPSPNPSPPPPPTTTDLPIWRVEVPEPKIDRDPAADARVGVSVARSHFNELAIQRQRARA
jgi:hypothetical protein